jgi:transposase-like protein
MEGIVVQKRKDGRRVWTVDQKLHILEELTSGIPTVEVCRKYDIDRQKIWQWRKRLRSGGKGLLRHEGEIVPRIKYLAALKRIEELERALGRKVLENDILKKSYELKGLKLPDGT